jgi:ubiquinone/menaquinone biosynthesis C-methylase UbiE
MAAPLPNDLSAARLQQIYDRTAAFYDGVVAEQQAAAKLLAIELLAPRPAERLLEVGCGTGWLLSRVIAATGGGPSVLGIDAAPGMIEVARQRLAAASAGTAPPLALADARALPFADAAFDCLLTTYTLECLPMPHIQAVLAECRRVLRPGGRLVAADLTQGEGEDAALSREWERGYLADPEYFGGTRPLVLTPLLQQAGFRQISRRYSGHGRGWPSEVVLALR